MMTKAKSDDTDLGLYFQAAQHQPPIANEALLARVLADALTAQTAHGFPAPRAQPAVPLWRQLLAALGGWQGVGGMATAGLVGVWLGFSPPAGLDALALLAPADGLDLGQFAPAYGLDLVALEEG
jgi:hypothetical protein